MMPRTTMPALIATPDGTSLRQVARPGVRPGWALVEVVLAGVCATDVAVSRGQHPAPLPRILGHEFVGRVVSSERFAADTRVAVMPVLPDGTMLGVHHDGGFAAHVCVPETALFDVPGALPDEAGVFAEPVAACLAPAEVLPPAQQIWVHGEGRIATLTARCLVAAGHEVVASGLQAPGSSLDAIVETTGRVSSLDPLLHHLRRRGSLVLKSRKRTRVSWSQELALAREAAVRSVAYADFDRALGLLVDGSVSVASLQGPTFPLDQWEQAFAHGHDTKPYLRPCADS